MASSPVRVNRTLRPRNTNSPSAFRTICRLMPLSGTPSGDTAPPSSPPCPASSTMTVPGEISLRRPQWAGFAVRSAEVSAAGSPALPECSTGAACAVATVPWPSPPPAHSMRRRGALCWDIPYPCRGCKPQRLAKSPQHGIIAAERRRRRAILRGRDHAHRLPAGGPPSCCWISCRIMRPSRPTPSGRWTNTIWTCGIFSRYLSRPVTRLCGMSLWIRSASGMWIRDLIASVTLTTDIYGYMTYLSRDRVLHQNSQRSERDSTPPPVPESWPPFAPLRLSATRVHVLEENP